MYSDGKDDYVKIQIDYDNEIYINLTNKKATKNPKETIQFGYGESIVHSQIHHFITEAYIDESNIHSYGPWFEYKKEDDQFQLTILKQES